MSALRWTAGAVFAAAVLLGGCRTAPQRETPAVAVEPELRFETVGWEALPGWQQERLAEAWPALLASCRTPRMPAAWERPLFLPPP